MKTKMKLIFIAIIVIFLTSCGTTSFYQVYKTVPSNGIVNEDNYLVYEDDNCKISYNLWDDGGDVGFIFYNKTDEKIFLNLDDSFFVLNGVAYDYFKNRVFSHLSSSGITNSNTAISSKSITGINYSNLLQTNKTENTSSTNLITSSGYSVSYNEEKKLSIPSKTSKIITEYNINEFLYRDCDLFKYPTKKQVKTKNFSKNESPIVFSNRIAYTVENSDKTVKFNNDFYVSEISNYPESVLIESKFIEFCGQKNTISKKYFKNVSPDKFYVKYVKGSDIWKH
ncbi:MAG: hypothetical protein ABI295_00655 [Xanthomarina sp.]